MFIFFIFIGQEGLGRRVLSETLSAMDLFDSLQTRRFIDRDNLLYLQGMLYRINRTDLFDKVVEYATHTLKDTVYFKTPAEQPGKFFTWFTNLYFNHRRKQWFHYLAYTRVFSV